MLKNDELLSPVCLFVTAMSGPVLTPREEMSNDENHFYKSFYGMRRKLSTNFYISKISQGHFGDKKSQVNTQSYHQNAHALNMVTSKPQQMRSLLALWSCGGDRKLRPHHNAGRNTRVSGSSGRPGHLAQGRALGADKPRCPQGGPPRPFLSPLLSPVLPGSGQPVLTPERWQHGAVPSTFLLPSALVTRSATLPATSLTPQPTGQGSVFSCHILTPSHSSTEPAGEPCKYVPPGYMLNSCEVLGPLLHLTHPTLFPGMRLTFRPRIPPH